LRNLLVTNIIIFPLQNGCEPISAHFTFEVALV